MSTSACDFLFEIGTEEIPALSVDIGISQLKEEAIALLGRNRLEFDTIATHGSPRRLVLIVGGLVEEQPEVVVEVKGPPKTAAFDKEGNPTKAAEGFAANQGVPVNALTVREEGGREYVYAERHEVGRPTARLLPEILPELVASLSFPKSMRWGNGELRFVRPIRWLLALYGDHVIEFEADGLTSSNLTWGHRQLADNPIVIGAPGEYFQKLEAAHVLVDHERRAGMVRSAIVSAPSSVGGRTVINEKTFDEVVNLVEYPNVVLGSYDKEFVKLPRDVLTTAMESHQRYFPVENEVGDIIPYFLVVHNGNPREDELIRRGHERVICARLADARFFFVEDTKRPLDSLVEKLNGVVFQEQLGTMFAKTERVTALAGRVAASLKLDAPTTERIKRASFLSKADLTTDMVVEFPSLQGLMGRDYARISGEPEAVARAIYEHYMPRSAAGAFPSSVEGQVVAFADKLDTVVGALAVGLIPTGSEDPYALRRAAYGLVGIVLEGVWRMSLPDIVDTAIELYLDQGVSFDAAKARDTVLEFLASRARAFLIGESISSDAVDASLSLGVEDLVDLRSRAIILQGKRESSEMGDLLFAFNRVKNLARPELGEAVDESLFEEGVERELHDALAKVEKALNKELPACNYTAAIAALAALRSPVDAFFDGVLVMAEDAAMRENRIRLLNRARAMFFSVADFEKIIAPGG